MIIHSPIQNSCSPKGFLKFYLGNVLIFLCLMIISCGGGTSDGASSEPNTKPNTPADSVEQVESLSLIWSYDPDLKNPVTDLADCIQSIIDCVGRGTALDSCFDSDIKICSGAEPTDFCCTQECADQITQELAAGSTEQEAILNVFVYDGTCMPGIPEDEY